MHLGSDPSRDPREPAPASGAGAAEVSSAKPKRRRFLTTVTSAAMTGGIVAAVGPFARPEARDASPGRPRFTAWLFVAETAQFRPGDAILYPGPDGAPIAIVRHQSAGSATDFIALSTACPHLGCQVHWEASKNRFLCPCHSAAFEPGGRATSGPPSAAGQSLTRYPLKVEGGLLFIEVPVDGPV